MFTHWLTTIVDPNKHFQCLDLVPWSSLFTMAGVQLDVAQLSSFCSLPLTSIDTLITDPTVELVQIILGNISNRAREFDILKSDKLKLNVELENAVRGGESKSRVLKGSIDKGIKEAVHLREKLEAEGLLQA